MTLEKRGHKRFQVLDGPVLIDSDQIGTIQNISRNGLLCQCLSIGQHPRAENLCIACPAQNFCIEDIPFSTVREFINMDFFGFPTYKLCGIRFGKLSDQQSSHLQFFLDEFTSQA